MDTNNVYKASNSLRRNISAAYRNDTNEIFSSSLRDRREDDDEDLKWAALEKLPTFDRLRKGLLHGSRGDVSEVDVKELGIHERKQVLDRLVRVAQEDNEKFLLKLKDRMDRVGIELPKIEVRFEHLNVETEVHVGSRALPSFKNFFVNILQEIATGLRIIRSRKRHLSILKNASGILKPGRITLLLGPPSSGKTTLLLALAGKLDSALKVSGNVAYNGHNLSEFVPQRTAAYISQHDVHIGEMTVRETLEFSARCQGVGSNIELLAELSRREKAAKIKPDPDLDIYMKAAAMKGQEATIVTDYTLKILGLENCADTMVGDQMIRGISGGQRKRVTTGEMLVGPAKALFMDEISTGLDSSTTFQVVKSIRNFVHILGGTSVISLLQPEPETYNLFDDVILTSEGHIVYQGPTDNVLPFFESMGFKCPRRKGVADFLQEVTSKKDQKQYWSDRDKPYSYVTVKEFAQAFGSFETGSQLNAELAIPFDKSKSHPSALARKRYGVNRTELLKACASRELLLMKRNSFVYIFKTFRFSVMGLIAMTFFFRTHIHRDVLGGRMIYGSLFYTIVLVMMGAITEIAMTIQKLPVFYKQRDFFFYPSWAYGLASWMFKIPLTIFETAVYVALTYYVIGYDPNVGRLFKQVLVFVLESQTVGSQLRLVAAISRDMIIGTACALFVLLLDLLMSGFILSRENMKKWWLWCYYSSPIMYTENAIVVNEFNGHRWKQVSSRSKRSLGVELLKSRGFFSSEYWYWIGVGALFGMIILYNSGFILALTYLKPLVKAQALLPEEDDDVSEREEQGRNRGMILPFEPHSITFDDVKYSIDMPQEMKDRGATEDRLVLLKCISGAFRPGILTALMGVSGAGKTTLMDVLAGRKTGGYIEGSIMISGYPKKQETFARISGYCEQNDIHSPYVTVYESLLFSAWLRLPPEVDTNTRKMFVEMVLELVELTPLRGMQVGLPGVSGLSPEQRKRLTVAVELVANPSIIFMDEPTSGLDARAAAIVMRTVRNTVDTGRTVVCTIHQPSLDIFESFDELYLMKRGGQEIYVGPLGQNSCHLIEYFEGIEGTPKIRDGYNPATWMLEVTSSAQENMMGLDFAQVYKNSELYGRNKALIKELSTPLPGQRDLSFPTRYSQPSSVQFKACLWKQHLSYWRNPPYTAVRILFTAFASLIIGSVFWDLGSKRRTVQDLFNTIGSMYSSIFLLGMQLCASVQPVVAIERTVSYKERAAGMYSALPFAFGLVAIEIPYVLAQSLIHGTIVYAMIGYEWTAKKFVWYMFFMFFSLLYFIFYGMMTLAMTPNLQISSIIYTAFLALWSMFSGLMIPRPMTPVWWRWYHWACPVAWTLYGLLASQFGDITDQLDTEQSVQDFLRSYFGFRHDFIGVVAFMVVAFAVLFALLFALSVRVFNFQRR